MCYKLVFCNTKTNERRVSSKSSFLEKRKKTHSCAHTRTRGHTGREGACEERRERESVTWYKVPSFRAQGKRRKTKKIKGFATTTTTTICLYVETEHVLRRGRKETNETPEQEKRSVDREREGGENAPDSRGGNGNAVVRCRGQRRVTCEKMLDVGRRRTVVKEEEDEKKESHEDDADAF